MRLGGGWPHRGANASKYDQGGDTRIFPAQESRDSGSPLRLESPAKALPESTPEVAKPLSESAPDELREMDPEVRAQATRTQPPPSLSPVSGRNSYQRTHRVFPPCGEHDSEVC